MDILLITDQMKERHPIVQAAARASYEVIGQLGADQNLLLQVNRLQPGILVLAVENFDKAIIDGLRELQSTRSLPVVVFTHDNSSQSMEAALKVGVSSYIVDCKDYSRLPSLLEVAKLRFLEQFRLQNELDSTRQALQDRKVIDRAKGILMEQRQMSEDDAYRALRKMAMDKNRKIGEVAEQLVQVADMLV